MVSTALPKDTLRAATDDGSQSDTEEAAQKTVARTVCRCWTNHVMWKTTHSYEIYTTIGQQEHHQMCETIQSILKKDPIKGTPPPANKQDDTKWESETEPPQESALNHERGMHEI